MGDLVDDITKRNYYQYFKKYKALCLKRQELLTNLKGAQLNQYCNKLATIQNNHKLAASTVISASSVIHQNAANLEEIIKPEGSYINMSLQCHQPLQQLLQIPNINTQNIKDHNTNHSFNITTSLDNVNIVKNNIKKLEDSSEKQLELMLKVKSVKDKKLLLGKDVHKPRERRSHLSESTLLNPFQSINISTSSPKSNN